MEPFCYPPIKHDGLLGRVESDGDQMISEIVAQVFCLTVSPMVGMNPMSPTD